MLVGYFFAGFNFNNQTVFDKQVSVESADNGSVLVVYGQGMLLFYHQAGLLQTMFQTIFIHFFKMAGF